MRLWSLHPGCLDAKGLVACWREALLAKAVLAGRTRGYRRHPQLERFRAHETPLRAINTYLDGLYREAQRRGYTFDKRKAGRGRTRRRIAVTTGQVQFEMTHLKHKLRQRDPHAYRQLLQAATPPVHPLFRIVTGAVEPWERAAPPDFSPIASRSRRRGRAARGQPARAPGRRIRQ